MNIHSHVHGTSRAKIPVAADAAFQATVAERSLAELAEVVRYTVQRGAGRAGGAGGVG